jgi:hypothetical protein
MMEKEKRLTEASFYAQVGGPLVVDLNAAIEITGGDDNPNDGSCTLCGCIPTMPADLCRECREAPPIRNARKVYIPSAHPIETAWLLEYPVTEGCSRTNPLWLSIVEGAFHWTADANTATRFARQEDAQRVASLTRWELSGLIATEHQWS